MHPATESLLKLIDREQLPAEHKELEFAFSVLAHTVANMETEHGAELTAGLRKLLEAKDCIVRAALK